MGELEELKQKVKDLERRVEKIENLLSRLTPGSGVPPSDRDEDRDDKPIQPDEDDIFRF